MKLIYRAITNATTLVTVVLFLLLTLFFTVAPKAAAAVITYLFRIETESPFWTKGGVIFLGGAILWVGGILLAAGGASWLFNFLIRGSASEKNGEASPNQLNADVELGETPAWILEPQPSPFEPITQSVSPQRGDSRPEAPN